MQTNNKQTNAATLNTFSQSATGKHNSRPEARRRNCQEITWDWKANTWRKYQGGIISRERVNGFEEKQLLGSRMVPGAV